MALVGADVDQLRTTAKQFDSNAEVLAAAVKSLGPLCSDVSRWRGPDADRFRSQWSSASVPSVNAAVAVLRSAAQLLRRNADQQEQASTASGGSLSSAGVSGRSDSADDRPLPSGAKGLWDELQAIPKDPGSAGYRVEHVVGPDGKDRYIVYIAGTDGAEGQQKISNVAAANGVPDDKQLEELKRIIPRGADVMLVGYSQGGMDAQNIAAQKDNGFNVTQIVTFGSPVRPDLDFPAVHIQANGDGIPTSASIMPWSPYLTNSVGDNPDAKIYHGQSNVGGMGINIHGNSYSYLAEKWDDAKYGAASGISNFQGTVVDTKDLDVDGNVIKR